MSDSDNFSKIPEHENKFAMDSDHENFAYLLSELADNDEAFESLLKGARLDLTDAELLEHLKETLDLNNDMTGNIDTDWNNFKGNFSG